MAVHASSGQSLTLNADLGYSNGHGMIYNATGVGNYVTFIIPNIAAGTYDIRIGVKKLSSRGIVQLAIGTPTITPVNLGAPQDFYASSATFTEIDLGTWNPATTSDKYFQFTVTGKNASSTGYSMALDYIRSDPAVGAGGANGDERDEKIQMSGRPRPKALVAGRFWGSRTFLRAFRPRSARVSFAPFTP